MCFLVNILTGKECALYFQQGFTIVIFAKDPFARAMSQNCKIKCISLVSVIVWLFLKSKSIHISPVGGSAVVK